MKLSRLAVGLRYFVVVLVLAGFGELAHAQLEITEFMASNGHGLRDQDGDTSDWIEIHNAGTDTVNLNGWSLTDDLNDLTKWQFPATNLFANAYLIVFASGKNRAVAGSELHTSFSLGAGGEYLALVKPDGVTIASEFHFDEQFEDVSYGIGQNIQVTTLVSNTALARVFIPTNGPAPGAWTGMNFDDSAWIAGTNGVGYQNFVPGFAVRNFKANINVNSLTDAENVIATSSLQTATFSETRNVVNYLNTGGSAHYANDYTVPGFTINVDVEDYVIEATGVVTIPASGNWTFGVNSDDGFGLTVGSFTTSYPSPRGPGDTLATFSFPSAGDYPIRLVFYERGGGSEVEMFAAQGSFTAWNATNFRLVGDSDNGGLVVKSIPLSGGSSGSLRSLIRTDVQSQMLNKASTAYVRIPFTVTNTAALSSLTLQVKYDDGFVAYLNGSEIARRNVPASVQWNSTALASRSNALVSAYEDINVSPALSLLQNGANVLAFHALNDSTNSSDFLILAELSEFKTLGLTNHYFATPSPGGPNTSNYFAFVADTKFSHDRGFYDTNFSVTITSATPNVTIRWTTNCSAPSSTNGFTYTGPIPITGTTVLRARAYRDAFEPSDIDCQTYIFLNQVLVQTGAGFPTNWGAWLRPDYEMDPNVVNDPAYSGTIKNDLKSVPTMSIVVDPDQMFGPGGIYSNPTGDGVTWERAGSLEFFQASGGDEFQINCGVRVQGGASRDPNNSPKHGFRVLFKDIYGPTKLKFPLFEGSPVSDFDTFDLHAAFNDSWVWVSNPQGQYIRDVWCRDTQLDMGRVSPHGTFVHLYVNGLYWGLYEPGEKPDASFAAHYFGGDKSEYDALNSSELIDGDRNAWNTMMSIAGAGITNDAAYAAIQQYLDIPSFIDYMLINLYGGNTDWPWHNWTAARRRIAGGLFEFFSWDAEWIFSDVNANVTGVNSADTPGILYAQLQAHPEFRQLFGDHVQRHCFNGGTLTPAAVDARWMKRATEIDRAIVGESARWGDYKQEPPYTRASPWLTEQNRLRSQYFPQRTAILVQQLRSIGLFSSLNAPAFNQYGGSVPPGFQLYITNLNATGNILYTLDGTDPRLPGGSVRATAQTYTDPITLNVHTLVRARVKDGANWSAIVEGTFYTIQDFTKLKLTEIMYNPPGTTNVDGDEFEFLELKNTGTVTLDLSGLSFSSGINFTFTNNTLLAPGQFFVLARNLAQFQSKYPGVVVNGLYTGRLDNGGEKLAISHVLGGVVLSVTYDDSLPWPLAADGLGFSLVPAQTTASDPNDATYWRASGVAGGSPGADDPVPNIVPVVINEVLTHSDAPAGDMIEIYNPSPQTADVGGWFLTDDPTVPMKFRIPNGTMLALGEFYVVSEADFNPTPGTNNSFALSSLGEQVLLFSGDSNTNLTGYSHGFEFGPAATNVSFGRYITSVGEEHFPPQISPTFGATNAGPLVGPVVINEIMYHPEVGYDEFVELKNISGDAVPLFDPDRPTNTWKLSGLSYSFPQNITLPSGGYAVLVPIDPALFRTKYGVPVDVLVFGPVAGALQDSGERLELKRPGAPTIDSQGQTVIPFITVDEVRYNDKAPWPLAADGEGPSLQRFDATAYGNDPINWFASGISPGAANVFNSPPTVSIDSPTNNAKFTSPATINITASANDSDGNVIQVEIFANGARLATLTNMPYTFSWSNVGAGNYSLTAKAKDNGFAATISSAVVVSVNPPPVGNGTGLTGDYYDNIDFTGTRLTRVDPTVNFDWGGGSPDPIIGPDSFSVRWTGLIQPRFTGQYTFYTTTDDGVRLWINNQLVINNWTDHGTTDDLGVISLNGGVPYDIRMEFYENGGGAVAALAWVPPGGTREIVPTSQLYPFTNSIFRISRQPQSTNVIRGQTATFSVIATGFNPQTYQWYFNNTNLIAGATAATLTLTNVQTVASGTYRVVVNDGTTDLLSDPATLTVLIPPSVVSPASPMRYTISAGDTIVLTTTTSGTTPMSYDWRRNFLSFTNIMLNSNQCTITVTNVQPANNAAGSTNTYTVRLTNIAGILTTTNALIKVLNPPIITNQPVSQVTGAGSNVTFAVGAKGGAAQRQWYQNGSPLPNQTNASLNLTNVQIANEGAYFVMLTNVDGGVISTNVVLILDSDRDGLPDSWELAHSLNPTNSADAMIDSDGDGLTNMKEFIAGTDPQDPNSYLRIDIAGARQGGTVLTFIAVSNRTYTIVYGTNAQGTNWWPLMNIEPAVPTNRTVLVTNAVDADPLRLYRLVTPKLSQ